MVQRQSLNKNPSLSQLFISFLRLGATSFGGPAMVAYIRKMAVEQKRWLDDESFRDGVALSQTIPGATSMQTSAYVGLKMRGLAGALASFIGFGLPAFIFMMALSALYIRTYSLPAVVSAFDGLRVIVVAIVANAAVSFGRSYLKKRRDVLIAAAAAIMFGLGVNPIIVILLAALLGLMLYEKELFPQVTAGSTEKPYSAKHFFMLFSAAALGLLLLFLLDNTLLNLAILMSRIDLFAFGGGYASVPLMFHEVVEVRSWIDSSTFLNGIVLGQVTPGPIVITATFVGYVLYGALGGLVATIYVFLPSFLILVGGTPYFNRLRSSPYFNKTISGILCSFVGLLLTVTMRFALGISWDFPRFLLSAAAFVALLLNKDILWVVLIGTVISVIIL